MKYGYKKVFTDRRDADFHKSFGSTNFDTKTLPLNYSADAGLTMPDQNADGYPYGCTGYTSADLCTDEDGVIYDPADTYLNTPPGGTTDGRALRDSLKVLTTRGPRTKSGQFGTKRSYYYNIRSTGYLLDWFDAIRVALYITQSEKRSASIGIPWFPEFESPTIDGRLPENIVFNWNRAGGHNAKIAGWKMIGDQPYLIVKSWQGKNYGDQGWCYMSRTLTNTLLNMPYTEVFTVTKMKPTDKQTVDLTVVENVVSFILNLLSNLQKKII